MTHHKKRWLSGNRIGQIADKPGERTVRIARDNLKPRVGLLICSLFFTVLSGRLLINFFNEDSLLRQLSSMGIETTAVITGHRFLRGRPRSNTTAGSVGRLDEHWLLYSYTVLGKRYQETGKDRQRDIRRHPYQR